jgi:hypothetical protein
MAAVLVDLLPLQSNRDEYKYCGFVGKGSALRPLYVQP